MNVRIEETQVVHAPRERVFQTFNDYDAWPKFSSFFKHVTVVERAENTVRVNAEISVMGGTTSRTEKHVLTPPEQVLVSGEHEGATTATIWTFEETPEGTLVTAVVEAELTGLLPRILGPLAKRQLRRLLREWLRGLAKYAEAQVAA